MKRGAVELQFNWLFVLIVGGMLLLFAGMFIAKQKAAAERQIAYELLRDLRVAAASANVAGSANILEFQREVKAECGSITVSGSTKQLTSLLIFSPGPMKGEAVAWSQEFSLPYRAANFLYLADSDIRLVVLYDQSSDTAKKMAMEIKSMLPDRLKPSDEDFATTPDYIANGIKPEESSDVRIVLIGYHASDLVLKEWVQELNDRKVTALEIGPSQSNRKLLFYGKKEKRLERSGESYYADRASLYGALFSSAENYNCLMGKAFQRLSLVSRVYTKRTSNLMSTSQVNCKDNEAYKNAGGLMQKIMEESAKLKRFRGEEAGMVTRIAGLNDWGHDLVVENEKLQRQSCPEVY